MVDTKKKSNLVYGKRTFIGKTEGSILSYYDVIKDIGNGSFGKVFRVRNKITGNMRACKQLTKSKINNMDHFNNEIAIMTKADHPNIIKLYEIYEDKRYFYFIMEECTGGELFVHIIKQIESKKMYSETIAAGLFKQIMLAIAYCHSQNICHRDLKPENILMATKEDSSQIKIIDFGLSQIFKGKMTLKVGSSFYVAPEVLKGSYDEKCDIWSVGVILYLMLSGAPPFCGKNDNEIYSKIIKKEYTFPPHRWQNISPEAIDLISNMLCDSNKRLSSAEVLNHPWFEKSITKSKVPIMLDLNLFKRYVNAYKLKRVVLMFIASRVQDEEVAHLKEVFDQLDKNKDGTITIEEMEIGLKDAKIDKVYLNELFDSIDTDKSGRIDYTEFIAATLEQKSYLKEERLYEAFKAFDKNGSGKISKDEIMNVLKLQNESLSGVEELINEIDTDKNGSIDYNEFITMMSIQGSI